MITCANHQRSIVVAIAILVAVLPGLQREARPQCRAPVQVSGQKSCWTLTENAVPQRVDVGSGESCPTGQDGDKQAGVPFPCPRFTDNRDGTVTDNLTGLVWLKNANPFGHDVSWSEAIRLAGE